MRTAKLESQLSFDGFTPGPPPAAERRLASQCDRILAMLQKGTATNRQLAKISLKYSSRISELRQAGYNIICVSHDHKSGKAVYRLI